MKAILSTSKLFMALGICTLSACVMIGCVDKDKDYSQPSDGSNLNSFTFSTTQEIQLAVKYAIPAKDYQVLFEVYFENPFENKDGQIVKRSDVEPKVIRMTDGNGNYAGKEVLPGYLLNEGEEVYIYTSYIGVPTLYKTTVQGNMIRADINWDTMYDLNLKSQTRAGGSFAIPDGFMTLGEWNIKGRPNYLDDGGAMELSESLLRTINKVIPEGGSCPRQYRQSVDFEIKEKANVRVRFIGGTSSAASTFGYYCYKEGDSLEKIEKAKKYIIFPNTKTGQGIKGGECVQLHYIDENGEDQGVDFPAGVRIGWFIRNDAFKNGNIDKGYGMFYSTTHLNKDRRTHTAAFKVSEFIVLSFEDWTEDDDYNDVMFNVWSNPVQAIPDVPEVPDKGDDSSVAYKMSYKGIVAFEDNWPSKGDYDLNDAIVKYKSELSYNTKNEVLAAEDEFTAEWAGAAYLNSFIYQLNTGRANVECTKDEKPYSLDNDLSLATITVFDDMKEATGDNRKTTTVTISNKFKTPVDHEVFGVAPYNPFISVFKKTGYNRTEVHFINYKPTEKADKALFHTESDLSDLSKGIYYVSNSSYPFAIHLADAQRFSTTEGESVDKTFPKFASWAESKGTKDKDWYLK
jgi:LruC domain-containing protein